MRVLMTAMTTSLVFLVPLAWKLDAQRGAGASVTSAVVEYVVTGRVIDLAGQPAPDVYVSALFPSFGGRGQRYSSEPAAHRTRTDRNGEFRLEHLGSREFYLVAIPDDTRSVARAPAGSAITFYPSALVPEEAKTIRLLPTQAVRAEIRLRPARLSTISGRVTDSAGQLVRGGTLKLDHLDGLYDFDSHTIDIQPDGGFESQPLPPGPYFLEYREVFSEKVSPSAWKVSRAKVRVVDGNVTDVQVVPTPMVSVKGRIIVPEADRSAMPPTQIRVAAWPVDSGDNPGPQVVGNGKPDWTFEFFTWPGTGRIRVELISSRPPLVLSAVRLNGVDVMNKDLTFTGGQNVTGLEVELVRRVRDWR